MSRVVKLQTKCQWCKKWKGKLGYNDRVKKFVCRRCAWIIDHDPDMEKDK